MTLYKGDNLQAFDGSPIIIDLDDDEIIVSKAQFVINKGSIVKTFENPIFPIEITLDETDTSKLRPTNYGNLIIYDELDRKKTCEGTLIFKASEGIYNGN